MFVYNTVVLGDPQSTWEKLQYYVDRLPDEPFRNADLYFYDYSAEDDFVEVSAKRLHGFINEVFPVPDGNLFRVRLSDLDWRLADDPEGITLREHFRYFRLVLVGHSLGGVVIRRLIADEALNLASSESSTPLLDSEVVLMAPAHLGFQHSGKAALLTLLPFSALVLRCAFLFRAFTELQPGCHCLTQLHSETAKMAARFLQSHALRPSLGYSGVKRRGCWTTGVSVTSR